MRWLFWCSAAFVVYTYIGYPLAIWLASKSRPSPLSPPSKSNTDRAWPDIAVVVPVFSDGARLARKLENLRSLNYPGRMRIVVVSDGSTDNTVAIARSAPDVELVVFAQRKGKPAALNAAMSRVNESIAVFMDVRQVADSRALLHLIPHFRSERVGAVSGTLVHVEPTTTQAASIGLYWRYERWIRMSESRFRSSVGATGAFYAIRRVLWHDLPSDTLIDDFVTPMRVVHQGYDVKLEPRAVIYDELQTRVRGEFKRKVRTLMGNYQAMVREPWLFTAANPIRLQWLSHKVARLVLPYFLVVMLVSSYFLPGAGFRAFFFAQVLVYAIGLVGNFAPRLARVPLVGFIMTFTALKAASVVSLWRYAIRNVDSRWEKT